MNKEAMDQRAQPSGALDGIRVIDLTRILAGPFCTQLLADMGADVIKVENAEGDPVRKQGYMRDDESWYFAQFNRNKRSIVLDLYTDEGKAILDKLLASADVLVENFRPGVLDRMGLTRARLTAINPGLIVSSVTGYGSTGPYADRPSFDFIAQAMSGFMSVNGPPDGPPMRAAPPMSDLIAGLYTAFGTVNALLARERGGPAQHVESSLLGGLISLMAYLGVETLGSGREPVRTGNDHPIASPYGLFTASDGQIAVAPSNDLYVVRFLEAIELTDLLAEPRFATNDRRVTHREILNILINEQTQKMSVAHWIEVINGQGCPCGRVMGLTEVFNDEQVLSQEFVIEATSTSGSTARMTGFPVKMSETPCRLRRPAPALGEHTAEVLEELARQPTPAPHSP
jgi:CoA:oxalate CoA-transferase